ncbi:short chain dehydrogenase/reductase-like protein [Talaromyces proteolyticus]|uniref:Short chain dehydrogenase/reductase-like protein n=1 Tax=Talaromyces proteolyticus TaxID=1131652 RepID=A0AAD4KKN2_9EURO|nr:short chain dehydrogenase/reductase-like protein [Talaromyces proteolyticus]KAH8694909.1 short chain dehydrogenase/reductase-like protein [Talaromyces proteolyticus]
MSELRRSVLITGCAKGGIGHSLACSFQDAGLRVIATARNLESMSDLKARGIETFTFDVTSLNDIQHMRKTVEELTVGTLDILVNNAGKNCTIPTVEASDEDITSAFETNVFSVIRVVREFTPLLIRSKGIIVNIGSVAAVIPYVFSGIYNATKGALHAYSNTLRLELAPFGVRVMVVVTGGVKSRITRTKRVLSDTSIYLPISDEFERRVTHSQEGAMPNEVYAASVVKQTLAARPPKWFWQGNRSWIIWFFDTFFGKRFWDWIFPYIFGLHKLSKILKGENKK